MNHLTALDSVCMFNVLTALDSVYMYLLEWSLICSILSHLYPVIYLKCAWPCCSCLCLLGFITRTCVVWRCEVFRNPGVTHYIWHWSSTPIYVCTARWTGMCLLYNSPYMCVLSRSSCDKTPYISFHLSLCISTGATASLPSGGRGWRSASLLQTGCTHLQTTLEQMEETVLPSLSAIQITMRRCGHCRQILIYSGVLVTIGTSTVLFCFVNLFWATMMRPNGII